MGIWMLGRGLRLLLGRWRGCDGWCFWEGGGRQEGGLERDAEGVEWGGVDRFVSRIRRLRG